MPEAVAHLRRVREVREARGVTPTPGERYITADELADAMGVSRSTVKRWVRAGVPSETWGMRVRRFRLSEVEAWARERPSTLMASTPPVVAANVRRHDPRRR